MLIAVAGSYFPVYIYLTLPWIIPYVIMKQKWDNLNRTDDNDNDDVSDEYYGNQFQVMF